MISTPLLALTLDSLFEGGLPLHPAPTPKNRRLRADWSPLSLSVAKLPPKLHVRLSKQPIILCLKTLTPNIFLKLPLASLRKCELLVLNLTMIGSPRLSIDLLVVQATTLVIIP